MITFRYVRWKNLLSTGNYFTEIKLDTNTNTLVVGENGSGKSTMLDALCFGLFGKAFRNVNKPNLLNSINSKDCIVEDFTDIVIENDQELIDQAEDTMTILGKYIDNLTLNVESDKLKSLMRELYIEALNTETTE